MNSLMAATESEEVEAVRTVVCVVMYYRRPSWPNAEGTGHSSPGRGGLPTVTKVRLATVLPPPPVRLLSVTQGAAAQRHMSVKHGFAGSYIRTFLSNRYLAIQSVFLYFLGLRGHHKICITSFRRCP